MSTQSPPTDSELPPARPAARQATLATRLLASGRAALRGGLGEALWLFVTLRVTFSLFAVAVAVLFKSPAPCVWDGGPRTHTTGLSFLLLGTWQRWDACWYERIATLGYHQGDPSVTFFPLFPLLMRVISAPLAGDLTLSGLLVSGLAYIVAVAGLYRLVTRDFDESIARRAVLYLSIFPAAFFFFAPFSEALFLCLAVWTILLAREGKWGWATAAAFLVGLTRAQGALLIVPLAWELFRLWRARRQFFPEVLVASLPAFSALGFYAYTTTATTWNAFQSQNIWGVTTKLPWLVVLASWRHLRQHADVIETFNLITLLAVALLLLLGLRRLPFSYFLFGAPQLLIVGVRQMYFSPLMATTRYATVIFPIFVLLALWGGRSHRLHYSWLLTSLMFLAFLLFTFLMGSFVA
jgi:hypothetical protein